MIVILQEDVTLEQREELESKVHALGLETASSGKDELNVFLVVGDTRDKGLERVLVGHPAVDRVVPILPQRRYEQLFSRRSFLDVFISAVAAIFAMLTAGVTMIFLSRSGEERRQRHIMRVSPVKRFEERPYHVVDDRGKSIIVVRTAQGDYHALSAICTHSEICQVEWSAARQELLCPCHRAAFDVFGNVLHGPPPQPLRSYAVEVIGENVYLKLRS